jgi:hypothetical protein
LNRVTPPPYRFTSKRDVAEALAEELERLRPDEVEMADLAAIVSGWSLQSWADLARGIGCRPPTAEESSRVPRLLLACVTRGDTPTYVPPPDNAPVGVSLGQPVQKAKADRLLLLARATTLEEMAEVFELGGDLAWADELRLQALGARDAGRRV